MHIALEICIDIATYIAAERKLPRSETARDVFILLGENNVISEKISKKMGGAAGFRNIIVHEYANIDYVLAYKDLDAKLDDLRMYAKEIYAHIHGASGD